MSVDIHRAVRALYKEVSTIETTVDNEVFAYDENGVKINVDMTLVNAWVDPETYKFNRMMDYPSLGDQLDMLWHAINSDSLDKTSSFYTSIKNVKDKYPKE